jgi:acyl CoA:acetate/3-ketoacid CoA transferase beta subunit
MDLVAADIEIIVLMNYVAKYKSVRVRGACTLPLTARIGFARAPTDCYVGKEPV